MPTTSQVPGIELSQTDMHDNNSRPTAEASGTGLSDSEEKITHTTKLENDIRHRKLSTDSRHPTAKNAYSEADYNPATSVRASSAPTKPVHQKKNCVKTGLMRNFSQQKLRAWQPVLTPKWIVSVFLGFGVIFTVLGIFSLHASNSVVQCAMAYDDPDKACEDIAKCTTEKKLVFNTKDCVGLRSASIGHPIYVYYELSNYYQNHRRYVKSRNDNQLRGEIFTDESALESCDPLIKHPEKGIFSPCGLIARSVFNDTFRFTAGSDPDSTEEIVLNEDPLTIAWSTDVERKFKNPVNPPETIYEWLNPEIFPNRVENPHFIVWMRSAALPTFRKLYARIDHDITLPITAHIKSRYPVKSFGGKKRVVLSTTSWLGGRNPFLGIAYLVIGSWCFLFGLFFVLKNHKNPRILGDVRYLKWIGGTREHTQ